MVLTSHQLLTLSIICTSPQGYYFLSHGAVLSSVQESALHAIRFAPTLLLRVKEEQPPAAKRRSFVEQKKESDGDEEFFMRAFSRRASIENRAGGGAAGGGTSLFTPDLFPFVGDSDHHETEPAMINVFPGPMQVCASGWWT